MKPSTRAEGARTRRRGTPAGIAWRRKNVLVDQRKLDKARKILNAPTETSAIDTALDLVAFPSEIVAGLEKLRAVGGLPGVRTRK